MDLEVGQDPVASLLGTGISHAVCLEKCKLLNQFWLYIYFWTFFLTCSCPQIHFLEVDVLAKPFSSLELQFAQRFVVKVDIFFQYCARVNTGNTALFWPTILRKCFQHMIDDNVVTIFGEVNFKRFHNQMMNAAIL